MHHQQSQLSSYQAVLHLSSIHLMILTLIISSLLLLVYPTCPFFYLPTCLPLLNPCCGFLVMTSQILTFFSSLSELSNPNVLPRVLLPLGFKPFSCTTVHPNSGTFSYDRYFPSHHMIHPIRKEKGNNEPLNGLTGIKIIHDF